MLRIRYSWLNDLLEEDGEGYVLKSNARNPFPTGYKPEIDVTDELDQTLASRFMQLIGILCWAIEIGRIDIFLGNFSSFTISS